MKSILVKHYFTQILDNNDMPSPHRPTVNILIILYTHLMRKTAIGLLNNEQRMFSEINHREQLVTFF